MTSLFNKVCVSNDDLYFNTVEYYHCLVSKNFIKSQKKIIQKYLLINFIR